MNSTDTTPQGQKPASAVMPGSADLALLGLLADIRAAAGDPLGRLMQDELVERIRGISASLVRLHHAVTVRMSADEPTGEQRMELLKAWEEAGRLIVPNT